MTANQAAPLGTACRVFAPVYRQVTLTALAAGLAGTPLSVPEGDDPSEIAYGDVVDAWNHYLEHDNGGRGVILVGHSQGAGILDRLIRRGDRPRPVRTGPPRVGLPRRYQRAGAVRPRRGRRLPERAAVPRRRRDRLRRHLVVVPLDVAAARGQLLRAPRRGHRGRLHQPGRARRRRLPAHAPHAGRRRRVDPHRPRDLGGGHRHGSTRRSARSTLPTSSCPGSPPPGA